MAIALLGTAACAVGAFYVFLLTILHLTQDRREPPVVLSTIPFISPILGMVKWSMDFYPHMRQKFRDLPIYTLRMPGTRIYVINSLELIPMVQRQWRTLIFGPISVQAAQAAMGSSDEALAIMRDDMVTEHGFINGMIKATHPAIGGGLGLDELNTATFRVFDDMLGQISSTKTVNLFEWVSRTIMRATTDAIFGPQNPMRDTENLMAWDKYHPALMYMMLGVFPPKLFFGTAVRGRECLVNSFSKYYANGSYEKGSVYIQKYVQWCVDNKTPKADIARFLVGSIFNTVANSVPTAFWVIYHIFSDPEVLKDCRKEVSRAVKHGSDDTSTIDLTVILNSCPVLMSTFRETFRYHGMANSVRVVSEDHMLDGKYLLKKGGLVMMSAKAQHTNPDVWGENVGEFYHKRFLKQAGGKRPSPLAFRGFGGGTTMCPGRHFATSEILMLAALLILRFDIRPTKFQPWTMPSTAKSSQAEAMDQPDNDIEVEFVPRPEAECKTWVISFSGEREGDLSIDS